MNPARRVIFGLCVFATVYVLLTYFSSIQRWMQASFGLSESNATIGVYVLFVVVLVVVGIVARRIT